MELHSQTRITPYLIHDPKITFGSIRSFVCNQPVTNNNRIFQGPCGQMKINTANDLAKILS